jgi:uncharacterized protein (TIGR02246 family)
MENHETMKRNIFDRPRISRIALSTMILCAITFTLAAEEQKSGGDSKYAAEVAAARRAIDAGNAQWIEGWRNGDAAMVAAIFTPDGMQLQRHGKILAGRDAIMKSQRKSMESVEPGVEVKVETSEVWIVDGDAYETGKWTYKSIEKGKKAPTIESGRYVTRWKKQPDGSWKLYLDMNVPLDEEK